MLTVSSSTITDILVLPHGRLTSSLRASVAVVIDHRHIVWSECVSGGEGADIERSVREIVTPVWVGRHLQEFDTLLAKLDALTEEVTFSEEIPISEDKGRESGISRRALLTGQLWRRPPLSPQTRTITRTLPLPPGLRYALSRALFTHLAREQGTSLAEMVAAASAYAMSATPTPLLWEQEYPGEIAAWPSDTSAGAWAWRMPCGGDASLLGVGGASLQRVLRQTLQDLRNRPSAQWPSLLLVRAQGQLEDVFAGDVGKVLGALYGLEQVAKPLPLCIENPFPATTAYLSSWRTLHEYLDFRGMNVQLVLHSSDTAVVADFLSSGVVSRLRLVPEQWGSLRMAWRLVQQCRELGVKMVLGGGEIVSTEALRWLGELALAWDAEFVTVPISAGHAFTLIPELAMLRSLAWQRYRALHSE